jgi:hypothetical protein
VRDVPGLWEPWYERAVFADRGKAADVIEMQVAGKSDVDVLDGETRLRESVIEMVAAIEFVDLRVFRVHLVAAAGVDDHRVRPAAYNERAHAERNTVRVIRRQALVPQVFRHRAEHGTAIEGKETIRQRDQLEVAERAPAHRLEQFHLRRRLLELNEHAMRR